MMNYSAPIATILVQNKSNVVEKEQRSSAELLALQQGGLVVYPTEAVWGIGCDPKNEQAVLALLKAKKRPVEKGLILIAADYSQILPYIDESKISAQRKQEILDSWPGAFTWLLPVAKNTPDWITGGSELVAVRVTAHPTVIRMCNEFGGAIISTSANVTGTPTEQLLINVKQVFGEQVNAYVDEALGGNTQASTIINSLTGEVIRG